MTAPANVLVIGAGPAGLAAATRLLERGAGRVRVTLAHMGHHVGGKAASYTDARGRLIEHGWHMTLGFYDQLRALMRRAGVDPDRALVSMGGYAHCYESHDRQLHTLHWRKRAIKFAFDFLAYDGLPEGDRLHYARFMAGAFLEARSPADLTRHDDICFRTWAIERGLRPHITRYSLFRNLQEAYFNFPESISAYHVLQSIRMMRTPERAEMFVATGGLSERIWEPIARYFERLGGTITPYTLVTGWEYDGRRVVGVRVADPDGSGHHDGASAWTTPGVPATPGSERILRGFDQIISTIPHAVFVKLNADDARLWDSPYFRRLRNLRSAATVSMTALTRKPVLEHPGPVFGLPAPLGICVNMKPYWTAYRARPEIGAALHFVGQEAGFEAWTDAQIIAFTLDNFAAVADIRGAELLDVELHRNRSDFERLLLCEPGVHQFRPGPRTPFHNLFLAGDWVRNDIDLICMEGATVAGLAAADLVLEELRA